MSLPESKREIGPTLPQYRKTQFSLEMEKILKKKKAKVNWGFEGSVYGRDWIGRNNTDGECLGVFLNLDRAGLVEMRVHPMQLFCSWTAPGNHR